MVVLVGAGHLTNSWGIPARARKRQAGIHKTVVLKVGEQTKPETLAQSYADFVWLTK